MTVDRDEVERIRKRFMKLDKVREYLRPSNILVSVANDGVIG
jgi:hypothetical protein